MAQKLTTLYCGICRKEHDLDGMVEVEINGTFTYTCRSCAKSAKEKTS